MKAFLRTIPVLTSLLIASYSFAAQPLNDPPVNSDKSSNKSTVCYVRFNDGTIKTFASLKLVTGILQRPHLLANGKEKIYASDIIAYQNAQHFAVSQKTFCCGRTTKLATETLPGFAVRVMHGKINVYRKKYLNGNRAADEYYVQAGESGKIVPYTEESISDILKDDPDAIVLFNNAKKVNKDPLKCLEAAVEVMNNDQVISRN